MRQLVRTLLLQLGGLLFCLPAILGLLYAMLTKGYRKVVSVKHRPLPPSILTDHRWGDHSFIQLPGLKMHYVEKGDREKTLMVFLHGFPEFWFSWRHQIEKFSQDYWCVAPDMRGYGDTEKPTGVKNYTLDILSKDVRNLVHGIKAAEKHFPSTFCSMFWFPALGRERCILVGHDWGGVVGYDVAERYPDLVTAYVACNTVHPRAMSSMLNRSWRQRRMSWYIMYFQCPYLPEMFMRAGDLAIFDRILKSGWRTPEDEEAVEAYKYTYRDQRAFNGPLNYYRSLLRDPLFLSPPSAETTTRPPRIRVPTLSIFGVNDTALGIELVKESGSFVDDFKEVNLEGVSHWVQMDAKDEVNRDMERYLKERNL